MKAKLETYKYQMNAVQLPKPEVSNSQVVNVTNSVNVNITFEQVRKEVEEMTSLTNKDTEEILEKISEIEEVVKSKDSKKSKWEKVKPVLTWLADKSCDVGIALLPPDVKIGTTFFSKKAKKISRIKFPIGLKPLGSPMRLIRTYFNY